MAFYADKHVLMDGAVVLYRRHTKGGVAPGWQARFKLPGRSGYQIVSCKTSNYEQAVVIALDRFHDYRQKAKNGQPLKDWTFRDHWKDWFERQPMSPHRQQLHRHYYRRYFEEYFGAKPLSEITVEFAEAYWPWRRAYWANHQNLVAYNPKRKGAKSTGTPNAKHEPIQQDAVDGTAGPKPDFCRRLPTPTYATSAGRNSVSTAKPTHHGGDLTRKNGKSLRCFLPIGPRG